MDPPKPAATAVERGVPRKVVYVPACVTRIMGPSKSDTATGGWGGAGRGGAGRGGAGRGVGGIQGVDARGWAGGLGG